MDEIDRLQEAIRLMQVSLHDQVSSAKSDAEAALGLSAELEEKAATVQDLSRVSDTLTSLAKTILKWGDLFSRLATEVRIGRIRAQASGQLLSAALSVETPRVRQILIDAFNDSEGLAVDHLTKIGSEKAPLDLIDRFKEATIARLQRVRSELESVT